MQSIATYNMTILKLTSTAHFNLSLVILFLPFLPLDLLELSSWQDLLSDLAGQLRFFVKKSLMDHQPFLEISLGRYQNIF